MAFQKHPLASRIEIDPKAAAKEMLDAYTKAKASQRDAAGLLGISEQTFIRWAKRLDLGERLAAVKARAIRQGWHHDNNRRGGRPPVTTDATGLPLKKRKRAA